MKRAKRQAMMALAVVAALSALPFQAEAGKLAGEHVKPDMKYKPVECKRPDKPKIKGKTLAEYNQSVSAYEAYLSAQHGYADCVERVVGKDMKAVQDAIFTGGQEAIAQSQRDIDNIKHELDFLRAQLEGKNR